MRDGLQTKSQKDAYSSPWNIGEKVGMMVWIVVWTALCRPTPKIANRWRLLWLKLFGCRIHGLPFVSASARITMPWLLELRHRACLGDRVTVYNLARVIVGERATVAQEAYLCGGTHDLTDTRMPLVVGEIAIGDDVFVGARAFVLPGITIARNSVVGACAVVTKNVAESAVVAGNPARPVGERS